MNISLDSLKESDNAFHGIVLGKPVSPLGAITLDIVFGEPEHFRKEKIDFDVVDWPSQYHSILGRPTFARFMAVPHYAYLMLKMPGPKGVITIRGSFRRSDSCDVEFSKLSQSFGMQQELKELAESTDHSVLPLTKKTAPDMEFDTKSGTRAHQVHPTDPKKTALMSTTLPIA
jgi:hypothetical protein